jgi:hypothetical protein
MVKVAEKNQMATSILKWREYYTPLQDDAVDHVFYVTKCHTKC